MPNVFTLEGLTEQIAAQGLGFGLGFALGQSLSPAGTKLAQAAWSQDQGKVLDPETAAQIAAERVALYGWAVTEAGQSGVDSDRFQKLYDEVLNAPGLPTLVEMLRRKTITPDQFLHGLNKARLEDEWSDPLEELESARLSPQELAVMAQRSVVPNVGLLPVTFDNSGSNVIPMPMANVDTLAEAAAAGYDFDRLAALARIVGLPPAPGELMQLLNRSTINEDAFRQGISEGNTRNEWADALMTLKRRLLTPHEWQEAALRGVKTNDQADAGSAMSGMETEDAQTLFAIMGRPLAVHQITTGLERGGTYGGTYNDIPEPYRDTVRRSSIRPEYAVLAYANRYTIPSYFILKAILADGGMTPAEFAQYGKDLGWPPDLADAAAKALSTGTTAKGDPNVTKAHTQLWNTIHTAYVDSRADDTLATSTFDSLGVAAGAQPVVLDLWKQERNIHRSGLTPAQIKKTIGLPGWTAEERLARLADLGYSTEDATTFLAE